MTTLTMPVALYSELMEHLADEDVEHVAFLFTEPPGDSSALRVTEIYRVPPEGFDHQSIHHVALTDELRGIVIKRAWDLGGCLVEVHSHPGKPPAWFSPSDLRGFREWVPHVRWRLRGRTYIALVFSGDGFDALVWDGDAPDALGALHVDGREPQVPSGITYEQLSGNR